MFESFKSFIAEFVDGEKHPDQFAEDDYRLAAAAMLVHAAAIDGEMSQSERDKLHTVIKQRFALDDAMTDELITKATAAEHEAVDLYHFTHQLNRALDDDGRAKIVEMMWEIVYADGQRDELEDNLIWRAADLLGVSANERIAPRRRRHVKPVALITGASAGIGAELARVFARHGHELVLVARREDRLIALADEIAAAGRPRPAVLAIDLEPRDAVACIAAELASRGLEPAIVVNNAGFGLAGTAAALDRNEQLGMIDLNIRALTELSLAFVDSLARHRGGILNVASIAAFLPGPGMAVYYASKAYVLSFSEALHRELKRRGIRVTALCPGPVPTEFQARSGMRADRSQQILTLSADRVAQIGYEGFMRGKRVVVAGLGNKIAVALLRLTPHGFLMPMIERHMRNS